MQKNKVLFKLMVRYFLYLLCMKGMATAEIVVSRDDIITGMKYNESLIQDTRVVYSLQRKGMMPSDEVMKRLGLSSGSVRPGASYSKYGWAKKGIMEYYEIEEEHFLRREDQEKQIVHTKIAFDGEKTTTWSSVRKMGGIYAGKHEAMESDTRPSQFAGLECQHKGTAFSQLFNNDRTTLLGKETVSGQTCYILESKPKNDSAFGIKAWIDIERGYRPLKIQHYYGPRLFRQYEVIQLQEINPGIWFPTQSKLSTYWRNKEPVQGDPLGEYDIKVENVEINTGLPNEMFRLTYEPGTLVYDDIVKTTYKVE